MNLETCFLLFLTAFIASLSHCAGMCGGIVISFNMQKLHTSKSMQALVNILYFIGRMCGYIIVGVCFTLIGKSFSFGAIAEGIIFIVIGILLFLTAFFTTFYPKILHKIIPITGYDWYKNTFAKALKSQSMIGFFVIGILNGFLPCHLVYMFALKAADSLNLWYAILTMVIFSLATFLPLFLIGMFSVSLMQSKLRNVLLWLTFAIMSYFAFASISNGIARLSGDTSHSHMIHQDHDTIHKNHAEHNQEHTHDSSHDNHTTHNHSSMTNTQTETKHDSQSTHIHTTQHMEHKH